MTKRQVPHKESKLFGRRSVLAGYRDYRPLCASVPRGHCRHRAGLHHTLSDRTLLGLEAIDTLNFVDWPLVPLTRRYLG
jgi:hypothetical protein